MSDFHRLSESVLVSAQLTLDEVEEARVAGVRLIVNNRPEGEAGDQTPGSEIEAAARAAGIDYLAIPIAPGEFGEAQVRAMRDALDRAAGKVLAYCRSGTRSTFLWALAEAVAGADPAGLAVRAASAGYDIAPIRAAVEALASQRSA